jgi:hypothetical protein
MFPEKGYTLIGDFYTAIGKTARILKSKIG